VLPEGLGTSTRKPSPSEWFLWHVVALSPPPWFALDDQVYCRWIEAETLRRHRRELGDATVRTGR